MSNDDESPETYVELRFSPSWQLISDIRKFVSVFYLRMLNEHDAAGRIALAAHELLENAAKYSSDGEAKLRLEVVRDGSKADLFIMIQNRTAEEERARLEQVFARMKAESDPFVHYQNLIRSSRGRSDRAGLGLARIQAEADIMLDLTVEDELVTIRGKTDAYFKPAGTQKGE